jgi:succinoglycan biosynthesis transport protein ExoP
MSWRRLRFPFFSVRWWLIFLATVFGAIAAYSLGLSMIPVYEAKALLAVNPREPESGLRASARQVPTYAELANSTPLLRAALDRLRLPLRPEELQPDVRGEADTSTRLLTIRVRRQDPEVAAAIANALAAELIRRVGPRAQLSAGASPDPARPRLTLLQSASGGSRIRPRPVLMVAFGALASLFGSLAVAALVATARRTVRGEGELARLAPIPVLGSVNGGLGPQPPGRPFLSVDDDVADSYHRLSVRILSANGERPPRSLFVVGASGNEGSAAVAAQLALALAGIVGSVALTDLASERPIARLFGIGEKAGGSAAKRSSRIREGALDLERFTLRRRPPLVLGFPRGPDPWAVGREDAEALVALLLADASFVVFHARSLGSSAATLVWAGLLDAAVLVVRPARTRRDNVVSSVEALALARTNVVGAVLHTG